MSRIATFFRERERVKENLNEIKRDGQDAFEKYDPLCRYYADCLAKEPVEKIVMYESEKNEGRFLALNALFEAFQQREDFKSYKHIWVLHKRSHYLLMRKKYDEYENVEIRRVIDEVSTTYYKLLARAEYLFQGGNFPYPFTKRTGQFFLAVRDVQKTKPIVFEEGGDYYQAANHIRNVLMADAVLVPNESDYRRLREAYRLEGIFEGKVLVADAGSQAREILETVLDQKQSVRTESDFHTEKKRVLIYGAGMSVNGVTESLLALLHGID